MALLYEVCGVYSHGASLEHRALRYDLVFESLNRLITGGIMERIARKGNRLTDRSLPINQSMGSQVQAWQPELPVVMVGTKTKKGGATRGVCWQDRHCNIVLVTAVGTPAVEALALAGMDLQAQVM